MVSVQTDTPTARTLLHEVLTASFFAPTKYSTLSEDVPMLMYEQDVEKITQPFDMPILL